jgi:hypothetical protein
MALDFSRKINMNDWLMTVSSCPYKYAYDETGIAIDATNRSVIMIQHINKKPVMKIYPFNNIREWSYDIPEVQVVLATKANQPAYTSNSMGASIGASIGAVIATSMNQKKAQANTGLKVRVKDIDYPEWFIKFESTKTVSTELKRWMEIFTQYIHEDLPQTTSHTGNYQGGNYCPNCGAESAETAKFCNKCGTKIKSA